MSVFSSTTTSVSYPRSKQQHQYCDAATVPIPPAATDESDQFPGCHHAETQSESFLPRKPSLPSDVPSDEELALMLQSSIATILGALLEPVIPLPFFSGTERVQSTTFAIPFVQDTSLIPISVAVNMNASILVVALGSPSHKATNFCSHPGHLQVIHSSRPDPVGALLSSKGGCITAMAFHPQKPAVLALGSFSASVAVYNVSRPDPLLFDSGQSGIQGERVVYLQWVLNPQENKFNLFSAQADGQILVWSTRNQFSRPVKQWQCPSCCSFAASPRLGSFFVGSENGTVITGSYQQSILSEPMKLSPAPIDELSLVGNSLLVASAGTLTLRPLADLSTEALVLGLSGCRDGGTVVAMYRTHRLVLLGTSRGNASLLRLPTGDLEWHVDGPDAIRACAGMGEFLVVVSGRTLHLLQIREQR